MIVVLAAPGAVTSGVRDVVRDWAALGLVRSVLWVEEAAVDPALALGSVVATLISPVEARRVRLQDELANMQDLKMVRLVSLGVQGRNPSFVSSKVATHMVNGLAQGVTFGFSAIQLILTRHGGRWLPGFEQEGWRTLVVAPEDAFAPNRPATETLDIADDTEAIAHSASALAAISGMWVGMDEGPLDEEPLGAAEPRVVRTFLRRLDAGLVASDVRRTLYDVSSGLPRPRSSQGSSSYFQNPATAVDRMAGEILAKHEHLFGFREQHLEGARAEAKSWWRAILDFLRFLKLVILSAPRDLIEGVVNRGAGAVSRRVQNALYGGEDSRYEVVTRGINARGMPFGADEIALTARKVAQRCAEAVNSDEQSLPDLSSFWRDVIAGGLTLADAGTTRLPNIDPQLVQGLPGVVHETFWVAPAPKDAFALKGTALAQSQLKEVSPYDLQIHEAADQVLAKVASEEPGAGHVKEQFDEWRQRVTITYTGRIAQRLSTELIALQQRLAELMDIISRTDVPEVDEALSEEQRKMKRSFWRWLLGFFAIAAVAVVVGSFGLIGVLLLVVLSLLVEIGWTARSVLRALKHQQRIFAVLNSRKAATDAIDHASMNVALVASALYRVATLYSQFLAWAPILGQFLHEPFGPTPPNGSPARLKGLLPRSVGFGVALPDETVVANTAAELSQQVFEAGWLSELWRTMIGQAPDQLGPRAVEIRSDPNSLLADPADDETSLLRQWSALISENGVPRGVGDEMWRRSRDVLMRRGLRDVSGDLFNVVEVQAQERHGITAPVGGDTFFAPLIDSLHDIDKQVFLTALFEAQAQVNGLHRVAVTIAIAPLEVSSLAQAGSSVRWITPQSGGRTDLDQFLVVVQLTSPVSSAHLTIHTGESGPGSTHPAEEGSAPTLAMPIVDLN